MKVPDNAALEGEERRKAHTNVPEVFVFSVREYGHSPGIVTEKCKFK